jgi:8-oxo-dGTP pyrophosphatase MutT (NUDIX family)
VASAIEGGKIASTGAGSCEASDFADGGQLAAAAARAALRELVEETGIPADMVENLRPISFIRNLERGGKPEFVFAADIAGT